MRVAHLVDEVRAGLSGRGAEGGIGFVPTMGALHAGHLSLVRRARADSDVVVVSIFVNPLQFGPGEDFERYPRDLDADLALLEAEGADVAFAPDPKAFLPPWHRTVVRVEGPLTETLEGAARPGHFDGVATIVAKLLTGVGADRAYFGEKDYQQLLVIRRMVADLDIPTQIVGCRIVRDRDGLALSSRNAYLSAEARQQALALPAALQQVTRSWDGDADSARAELRRMLSSAPGIRLDYAEVADPETLEPLGGVVEMPGRALAAVRVGATRLIDNVRLEPSRRPDTEEA